MKIEYCSTHDLWFTSDGVFHLPSGDNYSCAVSVVIRGAQLDAPVSGELDSACIGAASGGLDALQRWIYMYFRSSDERISRRLSDFSDPYFDQ